MNFNPRITAAVIIILMLLGQRWWAARGLQSMSLDIQIGHQFAVIAR